MLWISFLRTLFFYFFLLVMLRVMGKRELGSLGPLDLVVAIIMAEVAAIPIESPERPLMLGVIPIVTIVTLEIVLSYLCLLNRRIRYLVCGRPSVVIRNGLLVREEMRRLRYSIPDLLEQLRSRGFHNVMDIEMAIVECDGELSVLPKSQVRPVNRADLGLPVCCESPPRTVIMDGEVDVDSLAEINRDREWLCHKLAELGIADARQVMVAVLTGSGELLVQVKETS